MLLQEEPEHQGVFLRITIISGSLSYRTKPQTQIQSLRRLIGFADFEEYFLHPAPAEKAESAAK
jgi:hypothetical protein